MEVPVARTEESGWSYFVATVIIYALVEVTLTMMVGGVARFWMASYGAAIGAVYPYTTAFVLFVFAPFVMTVAYQIRGDLEARAEFAEEELLNANRFISAFSEFSRILDRLKDLADAYRIKQALAEDVPERDELIEAAREELCEAHQLARRFGFNVPPLGDYVGESGPVDGANEPPGQ